MKKINVIVIVPQGDGNPPFNLMSTQMLSYIFMTNISLLVFHIDPPDVSLI